MILEALFFSLPQVIGLRLIPHCYPPLRYSMNRQAVSPRNTVRIIGGTHRRQKIRFPDHEGLRPTSDRIRETLFNWLQSAIPGSRCLDLFAGSGALGIEALSRGAAGLCFVENNRVVAHALEENLRSLQLDNATVANARASDWLSLDKTASLSFDVVFLDPPFADTDLYGICAQLRAGNILADRCLVYIETGGTLEQQQLPTNWVMRRRKKAGKVCYYLFENQARAVI